MTSLTPAPAQILNTVSTTLLSYLEEGDLDSSRLWNQRLVNIQQDPTFKAYFTGLPITLPTGKEDVETAKKLLIPLLINLQAHPS